MKSARAEREARAEIVVSFAMKYINFIAVAELNCFLHYLRTRLIPFICREVLEVFSLQGLKPSKYVGHF